MNEQTKIRQTEYEAKLKEIKNAPRFRAYIIELIEYDEQLKKEPNLSWELFKKRKYMKRYKEKLKNNNITNEEE